MSHSSSRGAIALVTFLTGATSLASCVADVTTLPPPDDTIGGMPGVGGATMPLAAGNGASTTGGAGVTTGAGGTASTGGAGPNAGRGGAALGGSGGGVATTGGTGGSTAGMFGASGATSAGRGGTSASVGTAGTGSSAAGTGGSGSFGGAGGMSSGKGGTGGSAAGASPGGGSGNAGTSFTAVSAIIQRNCGGSTCHGSREMPRLTSSNTSLYTLLKSDTVSQCGNVALVVPGNPAGSAIIKLINGECTERGMPFIMPDDCDTDPCIPQADLDTLTAWIQAGATNP